MYFFTGVGGRGSGVPDKEIFIAFMAPFVQFSLNEAIIFEYNPQAP